MLWLCAVVALPQVCCLLRHWARTLFHSAAFPAAARYSEDRQRRGREQMKQRRRRRKKQVGYMWAALDLDLYCFGVPSSEPRADVAGARAATHAFA